MSKKQMDISMFEYQQKILVSNDMALDGTGRVSATAIWKEALYYGRSPRGHFIACVSDPPGLELFTYARKAK